MFAMLASAAVLTGGEVKIDRYEVLPGNYYKHFGTKLDSDLLPVKDGRTVRKGLLTDGKIRYAPGTGVCYVFWHSKPEDSCVTFSLMLEKPQKIAFHSGFRSESFIHVYRIEGVGGMRRG